MLSKLLNNRSARKAGSITSAYAIAQAINSGGAFVRVPLLVGAIGIGDYGTLLAVLSFWPWFATMADATRQTLRVRIAESEPLSSGDAILIPFRRRLFAASALVTMVGVMVAMMIPLGKLAGPSGDSENQIRLAVFGVSLIAALSIWPAARTGWLEARGRLVLTNLLSSSSTFVGLPCLILTLHFSHNLLLVIVVSTMAFAAPVVLSLLIERNSVPRILPFEPETKAFASTLGHMLIWSMAALAAYGFDTIIVGAIVGAAAAAEYGVAIRILGLATIVPLALGPLLMVRFASKRKSAGAVTPSSVCRISGLFVMATMPLALAMIVGGPTLGRWLTHDQVPARQWLYVLLSLTALLGAASGPIFAAFTAKRGLPVRNSLMILGSLLNVGLSFFLALRLGTLGPALGSVVAASIQLTVLVMLMFRRPYLLVA